MAVPSDEPDLLAGRYRLGPLIARGGMAEVRRARDEQLHRDVALKIFRGAITETRRFEQETRVLASLQHPNLVRLLDAGETNGVPFLVLGLVEGVTLARVLEDGPLQADLLLGLGRDVAAGLAHVHAAGVVHRDVKPSNILIDGDGTALLADFGIARVLDTTNATQVGMVIGTARYLSPEQAAGLPITASTDIYSLGLVLIEGSTGRPAFDGTSAELAAVRLTRGPEIPEAIPERHRDLVRRMVATDPQLRPSAAEVAAVFGLSDTMPIAAVPTSLSRSPTALLPSTPASTPAVRSSRKGLRNVVPILLLAVGLAAALVAAAVASRGDDQETPAKATTTSSAETSDAPATTSVNACAAFEAEKESLEAEKQRLEEQYKDRKDQREALKSQLEEQKKAVEARKQQAGC